MEINIKVEPKEIAELASEAQSRLKGKLATNGWPPMDIFQRYYPGGGDGGSGHSSGYGGGGQKGEAKVKQVIQLLTEILKEL